MKQDVVRGVIEEITLDMESWHASVMRKGSTVKTGKKRGNLERSKGKKKERKDNEEFDPGSG